MNIAVCIKQVPDTESRIKIAADGKSIEGEGIKWIVNPYDEFAVEEALQISEKYGGEVTVISVGPASIEKTIREALAMGAQKAIRIDAPEMPPDPQTTARALAEVLKQNNYDLVLLGKQAIDDDHTQIASILGQVLDLPAVTVVVKLELDVDNKKATALREIEGGHEKMAFPLPAVVAVQRGINEPRYRSLKGIMAAKKIPVEVAQVSAGEVHLTLEKLEYPPEKQAGRIIGNDPEAVPELIRLLREEAKVL